MEARFRSELLAELTRRGVNADPVESRSVTRGMADVILYRDHVVAFVELKWRETGVPKGRGGLRASQRAFARRALKDGQLYLVAERVMMPNKETFVLTRLAPAHDDDLTSFATTIPQLVDFVLSFVDGFATSAIPRSAPRGPCGCSGGQ